MHFSTLNSTCILTRDYRSRVKADMYRNCEKLYKSFRESPITPSETPFSTHTNATQARNSTASGERATHPDFFAESPWQTFLFFLYYVIHIKVFTLEIIELLKSQLEDTKTELADAKDRETKLLSMLETEQEKSRLLMLAPPADERKKLKPSIWGYFRLRR